MPWREPVYKGGFSFRPAVSPLPFPADPLAELVVLLPQGLFSSKEMLLDVLQCRSEVRLVRLLSQGRKGSLAHVVQRYVEKQLWVDSV